MVITLCNIVYFITLNGISYSLGLAALSKGPTYQIITPLVQTWDIGTKTVLFTWSEWMKTTSPVEQNMP